jgi:hypothetical protein
MKTILELLKRLLASPIVKKAIASFGVWLAQFMVKKIFSPNNHKKSSKMEKGILIGKLESVLASALDNVVKLKGIWETFDGPAFKLVITAVDDNLAEKIPEPYKTQIRDMLTKILEEKDYAAACQMAAEFTDSLIDIPGIDDATEKMIFTGIFTVIAGLLAKIGTE